MLAVILGTLLACGGGAHWGSRRLTQNDPHGDLVSVTCEGGSRFCYREAARQCPAGFAVVDASKPAKDHYEQSMLVRCQLPTVAKTP